jgi:sulfonate transport system permease protein
LFILWFGIGELPKVLLVALGVSFPLYLNTFSAIRQVDPKLADWVDKRYNDALRPLLISTN